MTDNDKLRREALNKIARDESLRDCVELVLKSLDDMLAAGHDRMMIDHPVLRALRMAAEWNGGLPDSNQAKRMVN